MRTKLLLLLAIALAYFSDNYSFPFSEERQGILNQDTSIFDVIRSTIIEREYPQVSLKPLNEIKTMLQKEVTLSPEVIDKVVTTLKCAKERNIEHNNILIIIDYSRPSSEKRFWVFDLAENKLLFNTYVSHGIKSGTLVSNYFSNQVNSKASSIGIYNTEKSYRGRYGLSLRLFGLDKDFNDNAGRRYIVMHGAWYVDENFIKKYGRPGRSWGCPAVPLQLVHPIINTIKENSLFVAYYPNDKWFVKSRFLNCDHSATVQNVNYLTTAVASPLEKNEVPEDILFVDKNNNNKREEDDPIVVMPAESYQRLFHITPPLTRMLRRQINNTEYIALSNTEFSKLIADNQITNSGFDEIFFVIPNVKNVRGYYVTQMIIVNLGKIKEVKQHMNTSGQTESYTVHFETKPPINLRSSHKFIRWLGL